MTKIFFIIADIFLYLFCTYLIFASSYLYFIYSVIHLCTPKMCGVFLFDFTRIASYAPVLILPAWMFKFIQNKKFKKGLFILAGLGGLLVFSRFLILLLQLVGIFHA